jgi:Carboxypeptidase regulatory-like domain
MGNKKTCAALFPRIFLCLSVLSLSISSVFAQAGRGAINGLVTDSSGAIIPGATVTATNAATGSKLTATTTAAGIYSFISLSPGTFDVGASQNGFETTIRKSVIVTVDQSTTVNISMKVGSVSEVVTVNETSSLVDTTNSTVGQLISSDTIERVPLLTRNVFDLVQLSSGVTPANGAPNSSSSFAIENISSGRPGVNVSSYTINGAIVGSVYYMVDGSPLGIAENNAGAIIPALEIPEDGVEETRVETQNTPASYQSGGAGVISLVTKSGSNAFHGDAFGVFRPDVLAANEFFNKQSQVGSGTSNTPPSFHRYQEGGAIGGPILKNKLFFFGDYEATQEQRYDGSNYFTVPTTAERNGDFSGDSFTIYNPLVPDNEDGTRQPFANNIIPNPSSTALQFLAQMPKCNRNVNGVDCDTDGSGAINNFFKPGLDPTNAHRFDVRVDWMINDKQRFFGRYSYDHLFFSLFNAFGNMWDLNYAQNTTNGHNALLADDITINNSTVLQLRYSFTRHHEDQGGDPRQNGFDITTLGFPSSLAAEQVYKTLPYINFNDVGGGVGGTANWNTFQYASENSDATVSITRLFGKHELSAGFEYMKRFLNVGQPPASSGAYVFDKSATDQTVSSEEGGSDFASMLVGQGTPPGTESYNFTKDLFAALANPYYATFVEDTYRPIKALTITAGLRWDIFGGKTERHNRLEYFNPTVANTVNDVSYTGAEIYVNGDNRSPFTAQLKDFGPRLGFSWQPEHRLVIRGGGGFYFGPSPHMVGGAGLNSDGFSSVSNWDATCYNANGNTVINGTSLCSGAGAGSAAPSTTAPYSLSNPFPNGVVPQFSAPPSGLGNNLGISLNTMLRTQRTPLTYNFNFGVEYELPHEVVLSAGYVGSRGLFLPLGSADLNELDLATIGNYRASLCVDTSNPDCMLVPNQWGSIQPATNANYGSDMVPLWVSLQPHPQFGSGNYGGGNGVVVHGYPGGDSEYSSLQTKLQKRLTHHFTTLVSFTWGKLMTDDGNPPLGFVGTHYGAPQSWKDLGLEHAVSPQDVKYQFTGQASYDLPIGRGRAVNMSGAGDAIAGGWTLNGIVYLSTGVPIASPGAGTSPSYFNQRADMTCDPSKGASHSANSWFNYSCFAPPGVASGSTDVSTADPFVAGTAPAYLDHVRTMGAQNIDLSLYKHFSLGGERDLRLEVSSYNIGNRAQLGYPNVPDMTSVLTDPSQAEVFGQVTDTVNSPRQFQFGARFTF